ncbi:type IV pili twitching motility protein PilT [Candidatus Desantisbacteria bacterium CG2_30_40_21]|uniref:Type IV pili twitching motility protein PilT n=5 Tax=unclassified Candidatus Desantisiibacteriota TaxID=3106372 RepID=A0A2M7JDJ0_9BACT|nr:MAG: type IV pili twitching motility protein PilT [Candidatus Desantisbacteria bacterium CG2_30_40_21]PIP39926.1 MAG: type IV pili twitching motility protein PilT [Candidatus Desantisbacteria bacterium CG23_combo_of_CG06-09_8_20_14_all_40_23]PIX17475.1 MAG: type IV pili twitching motility protein PilT [Candidatus Desantisbacteria bacterium CG_4_8_14_3_um_filter_40_12]PIY18635.1 MAG: type IV pili twitching motility protein PilT [Candidatus Desantisbacteria bacterium CG_4_10_14_3_um_filter_40_1
MEIGELLNLLVTKKASDLYLKVARPPILRIAGTLTQLDLPRLSPGDVKNLIYSMMNEDQIKKFEESYDADFSYSLRGVARFRANAFKQRGVQGAVIRMVPYEIPAIGTLGLPPAVEELTTRPQGLILVTGPTGSGKSTTLAALIGQINSTKNCHIITVEDPIEFLHRDNMSTIEQREIEVDTKSFREALRRALRQDPDVILIGEMRDLETVATAISAAETGHLVLSTLHTNDATQTVDRIIDIFPSSQQQQVRIQLSMTLVGVVSQRLLKRADGTGRVAAVEIMINNPLIKDIIEKGNTSGIRKIIETSGTYWKMQTLTQSVAQLINNKAITMEEGLAAVPNADELRLALKGTYEQANLVFGDMTSMMDY